MNAVQLTLAYCSLYVPSKSMGKRTPGRPSYTASLATLIADGRKVQACCEKCREWKDVDLAELAAIKGADYDLWGRRTRCRITDGCGGWNRFYCDGRFGLTPMRDG